MLDAFSRRVVGWSMANHLRAELVLDALEMAVGQRKPDDVIPHEPTRACPGPDPGARSTRPWPSARGAGVRRSRTRAPLHGPRSGDACDNATCESLFSPLESEPLNRRRFRSQAEAKMAAFSHIEGFHNPRRPHSAPGYRSPIQFEEDHARTAQTTPTDQDLEPPT